MYFARKKPCRHKKTKLQETMVISFKSLWHMHTSLFLLLLGRRQKFLKSLVALDGEGAVDAPFI